MSTSRTITHLMLVAAAFAAPWIAHAADKAKAPDAKQLDRGRYLVRIAGCNDCHTPGYEEAAGNIPESQWLTGDRLGTRGPWGTTYPPNLRMYMQKLTEAQWLATARGLKARPPMPWFNIRIMSDTDLRAIYALIRHLGPAGQPAPAYLAPDKEPPPPYIQLVLPK